ncbi:Hsp70 family protein [bacterium]|nr:Hsp70 family protein [bacterium]
MKYVLGIDLGTTNSVVSVYKRGKPETIIVDGSKTFPSVISYKNKDQLLVGKPAKRFLIMDPEHSVGSVKRFIGNRKKKYSIYGHNLDPVSVSSLILKRLVEVACEALGEKINDVIITVPAYFTDAQKEDTRKAGEMAGLNVIRLIPEPTAAAIAYGFDKGKDQTLMVYDLGGGTFDVCILQVKDNKFNTVAVDGDSQLGGDDFDNAIVDHLMDLFKTKTGKDLKNDGSKEALEAKQKLKEAAENAKIELSEAQSTHISVPEIMGEMLDEELTLADYNKLIKKLLDKTIKKMQAVLDDANMKPDDIDRVILVGGSTRNIAVKEIVTKQIKEPFISDNVDECVSHGAAILGASLIVPDQDMSPADVDRGDYVPLDIEMINRTAHSLGVNMLNEQKKLIFVPIISKQSEYPMQQGMIAFTNRPFQEEVHISVYRQEEPVPREDANLGKLILKIRNVHKDQVPIGAIFELDEDGILHFIAVELPIHIGEQKILQVVQDAVNHDGKLDIDRVKQLMEKKTVKFEKIRIKDVN